MNLKEYFKPDVEKIRISFLLFFLNIFVFLISTSLVSTTLMPLYLSYYSVLLMLFKFPLAMISILIFLAYVFACYISKSKMWAIGTVLYIISISVLSMGMLYAINNWNIGLSCDSDSDCHYLCGHGIAVNDKYIELARLEEIGCEEVYDVCENGKCKKAYHDPHYVRNTARIDIEAVWNNSGKISFVIENGGTYTFSKEEVNDFAIYINGVAQDNGLLSQCITKLREPSTVCQIDTDVDFPTIVGSDGEVFIEVKQPLGRGGAYNCTILSAGRYDTC